MTLSDDQIAFIERHIQAVPAALSLKYGKAKSFEISQIEARQKAKLKLPMWYSIPHLLFPPAVSVEQSSSELTAHYKASLVDGQCMIDATGGMGIDTFYFAKHCQKVTYVEQNEALVECARHNFDVLKANNIDCIHANSLDFLGQLAHKVDWLYLDPARRATDNHRVFELQDCTPDVVTHLLLLQSVAKRVLIKVSPLLDIKQTLDILPTITKVHVVAVDNECKELLLELHGTDAPAAHCLVRTINFKNDGSQQIFEFEWKNEANAAVTFLPPQRYVYEPNVAVLKAGAFKLVANNYQLAKIAPHSHLYTSEALQEGFPGRIFEVKAIIKIDRKVLMAYLPEGKANLTLRNFPTTTDELRKKLKLKEGGDVYLLATTLSNGDKRLLVCKKIQ